MLAIGRYDRLTVKALVPKLRQLGTPALAAVRMHEAENAGRVTVLKAVNKLLLQLSGAGTPQHGLSSKKMALMTSDYGIMSCLSIKWP